MPDQAQQKQAFPQYAPKGRELDVKKRTEKDFEEMLKVRRRRYRQLGDRTPQQYWNESEKRFLSYAPPKDITEEDWNANFVMALTRNAVMSQVAKVGSKIPEARFRAVMRDGITEDVDSLLLQNYYRYANRRERADQLQVFNALGAFVRGNSCWFEGWEDFEGTAKIISDIDFETGDVKFKEEKVRRFGPKRTLVPVHEIFYKNIYCNDLRANPKVVRRVIMTKDQFKTLFGKNRNYKYVRPGMPLSANAGEEPFFKPSTNLGTDLIEVRYEFNSVLQGGVDEYVVWANGVILIDTPMPFNHKLVPLAWCITEPMMDEFLIGLSTPFKVMAQQDSGDGFWNAILDRETLYVNRPIMTTADDPDLKTYLAPNAVIPFPSKNGDGTQPTIQAYPIEGVTSSDLALFERIVQQGKEDSGAYGGATASTPRGGKIAARQAQMMEEEAKRLLGTPMSALEGQERDLAAMRAMNMVQFTKGHGDRIDIEEALLSDGRRGRMVVHFPPMNSQGAESVKPTLDAEELAGEKSGEPTEAIAVPSDWYDMVDRVEAMTETASSYASSRAVESQVFNEKMMTHAKIPELSKLTDWAEVNRESWKKDGYDPEKFTAKTTPQQTPIEGGDQGGGAPPAPPGGPSPGPMGRATLAPERSMTAALGA